MHRPEDPDRPIDAPHLRRRDVLGAGLGALGGSMLAGCSNGPGETRAEPSAPETAVAPAAAPAPEAPEETAHAAAASDSLVARGDLILFQGDSITDAGRDRELDYEPNSQAAMGQGYAWMAASGLLVDRPDEELQVYNRGISGDQVVQLVERWDADCLELQPNVLSILIGVNDVWNALNGTDPDLAAKYERDYGALLARTREAVPDVKLVLCEPFVLRCGYVDDAWFPMIDEFRAAARRLAEAHGARWVPFQSMFDEALALAPPEHWAADGVHPSAAGAALMAQAWRRVVEGRG